MNDDMNDPSDPNAKSAASAKKKSAPDPLPRARDVGARIRPLVPVLRRALPIGAAAVAAVAFVEASQPGPGEVASSCPYGHRPNIFERGVADAVAAVERVFGGGPFLSPIDPPAVAGEPAVAGPVPMGSSSTSPSPDGSGWVPTIGPPIRPTNLPVRPAGGISSVDLTPVVPSGTASARTTPPEPHPPRLGGKPVAPSHRGH